jgi:argininosuccinate lyase
MWAGRFNKALDNRVNDFNSSISFDSRLYREDITGSMAHAAMLGKCGIIGADDAKQIIDALEIILSDIDSGKLLIDPAAEDIHMFIEDVLTERIGAAGKKLHTARSRNDQIALDIRMYLKNQIREITDLVFNLLEVLYDIACANKEAIMSGYTHLQRAQPVTVAHYILAYSQMLRRDADRFRDAYRRTDVMPLGSGALAGVSYQIDREFVRNELGFAAITENSIDAVSDRDFVIELAADLSILMTHMSRFAEEIILWCSTEFGFIELDDAYSTGSSIMPQKKNPDVAELVRGKTGRVSGNLVTLLTVMKGIPLAYDKDMQEDKEAIFDSVDNVKISLEVFTNMLATMKINTGKLREAASKGFINATDAADYLVNHGVAFRDAHQASGILVAYCIEHGKTLETLSIDEYKAVRSEFESDIYDAIALKTCVNKRDIPGGPGINSVTNQLASLRKFIDAYNEDNYYE